MHKYRVLKNYLYTISAISEDGVIEAVEYSNNDFNIGVQWHPELDYKKSEYSAKIFNAFIMACKNKL